MWAPFLQCTSGGLARKGKHHLLENLSKQIISDLVDFDTIAWTEETHNHSVMMKTLLSILKELLTGKLHLSLPSYSAPCVVCLSLYASSGLARKGKPHLHEYLSMKVICDLIDFDIWQEEQTKSYSVIEEEHPPINIERIINLQISF